MVYNNKTTENNSSLEIDPVKSNKEISNNKKNI